MRTANKVEMPPWKMAGPMEDIVWISRWFISPLEGTNVVISGLAKLVRHAGIQNGAPSAVDGTSGPVRPAAFYTTQEKNSLLFTSDGARLGDFGKLGRFEICKNTRNH